MNLVIASALWLFLWISAPENDASAIKSSYPDLAPIETLRAKFLANLAGVSSDAKGLVAGLTIGERGLISEELTAQMKELSLTHLVAVSGANFAIVTASIFFLMSALGLGRNLRFAIAVLAMFAYVLLVGPESSVLRAATMTLFVIVGLWLGRRVNPIHPLSWAVIFLLVADPGLAVDFGFGLSVFATLGLLLLATELFEKLAPKMNRWLALGLAATMSAQLFTMPILLMLESSIPVYSIIANLLVEFAVAPVTILGIAAVVAVIPFPPVAQLLSFLASLGAWWITEVAARLSALPLTRLPFVPGPHGVALMVLLVAGITTWLLGKTNRLRIIGSTAAFISILLPVGWVGSALFQRTALAGNWTVFNCDVGQGDALLIKSRGKVALIDVGREPERIDSCLDSLGISKIDLLVLTHFDADHVGGIFGAVSNRKIERALISGFSDDRPLVGSVETALAAQGVTPEVAFRGMVEIFGDGKFTVLSPTFEASEAEDSNDASIITYWELPGLSILALGDLGEPGQIRLMRNSYGYLEQMRAETLLVKVAHHGSADQSREFYELVQAELAVLSVGEGNDYGHPSERILRILNSSATAIYRTDTQGPIAFELEATEVKVRAAGKLSL
ncbi:ComEC/Rec2 family competence protein [Aquiluna borgnonia]|uniref:ComEC/Rec2 family competence protein n=1 Tax=Aquiluna borgnonia TaxID=2499157 RepID=A0A7D4UD99_9MICO|nr:ComEC/Rec2 family competence protein [Aquiluna borgnonia]QKJ25174.1 ComEC/Rec2 family competence protein [Aquiluna borgnonia]